jgi:hypothetical protein
MKNISYCLIPLVGPCLKMVEFAKRSHLGVDGDFDLGKV